MEQYSTRLFGGSTKKATFKVNGYEETEPFDITNVGTSGVLELKLNPAKKAEAKLSVPYSYVPSKL
jgi:hypothetical protein